MNVLTLSYDVESIVCSVYTSALKASPQENYLFRKFMVVDVNGTTRLLMVVGAINQFYASDNICVAVLNPDKCLLREVYPARFYSSAELLAIVSGKCDIALGLWTDTRSGLSAEPYFEYTSQPAPHPRFMYFGHIDTVIHE